MKRDLRVGIEYKDGSFKEATGRIFKSHDGEHLQFVLFDNGQCLHVKDFDGTDLLAENGISKVSHGEIVWYSNPNKDLTDLLGACACALDNLFTGTGENPNGLENNEKVITKRERHVLGRAADIVDKYLNKLSK